MGESKKYNVRRHYDTQHVKAHKNLSDLVKNALAVKLSEALFKEQQVFPTRISEGAIRASFAVAHKIAVTSVAFNEGEFVKDCLLACSDILCPKETKIYQCEYFQENDNSYRRRNRNGIT